MAVGLAVGAATLAAAATDAGPTQQAVPSQTTPSTQAPQPGQPGGPGPRRGFGPGKRGAMGPGIHGEFTVPAPNGGYETLDNQIGTVSSVSPTAIKVKSEDGFEKEYVVDDNTVVNAGRDGIADVKTGDTVRLVAVVTDKTSKAVQVQDITAVGSRGKDWRPARRGPGTGPGGVAPGGGAPGGTAPAAPSSPAAPASPGTTTG